MVKSQCAAWTSQRMGVGVQVFSFLTAPFSGPQRLPSYLGSPSRSVVPDKGSMGASSPIPGPCPAAAVAADLFSCPLCPLQQHWTRRLGPCPDSWALVPLIMFLGLPPCPSPAVSVPDLLIHHRRCLRSTAPLWQPIAWLLPGHPPPMPPPVS